MAITILSHSCLGMCTTLRIFKALEFWSEIGSCLVMFDHWVFRVVVGIVPQPELSIMGSGGNYVALLAPRLFPDHLKGHPDPRGPPFSPQFRRRMTRKRMVEILVATAMWWITSPAFLGREPIAQFVSILGFCRPETCWAASSSIGRPCGKPM